MHEFFQDKQASPMVLLEEIKNETHLWVIGEAKKLTKIMLI
jgi:hypothetical protein